MSTPTPTPGPTPACLEWIALCNVQFLCIGHSYARHLIVGQVKLQADPNVTTQPGLGRAQTGSGDCSLLIVTEPFLRLHLIKGKQYLNPRYHGHREPAHYTYMANVTVQIVLSSAQMRLQEGLIPRPEQNDTFQLSGPGWVWDRNFDRLPSLLCRTTQCLVRYLSSSQSTTKICAKMA